MLRSAARPTSRLKPLELERHASRSRGRTTLGIEGDVRAGCPRLLRETVEETMGPYHDVLDSSIRYEVVTAAAVSKPVPSYSCFASSVINGRRGSLQPHLWRRFNSTVSSPLRKESNDPSKLQRIYVSSHPPVQLPTPRNLFHYHFPLHSLEKTSDDNRFSEDLPAFIDIDTNRTHTRKDVQELSLRIGYGLLHSSSNPSSNPQAPCQPKLQPEDVVALFSPNSIDYPLIFFAAVSAGLIPTLANAAYTPTELVHQLIDSGSKIIFIHPDLVDVWIKAKDLLREKGEMVPFAYLAMMNAGISVERREEIEAMEPGLKTLDEMMASMGQVSGWQGVQLDVKEANDTAVLCYSSGTTGTAKGVMSTHTNMIAVQYLMDKVHLKMSPEKEDKVIGVLPFFHIYGLLNVMLYPLSVGVPVYILSRFEPHKFLSTIETQEITFASIVPPIVALLASSPIVSKYDLSSLRLLVSGGAPLGEGLIKKAIDRLGIVVAQGYGLTETSPVTHIQRKEEVNPSIYGSVGRLVPNMQARLLDVEGNDVDEGSPGEMVFKGPNVMKGYWKNERHTRDCFTEDGWYRTGDVAKVDEHGNWYIVDRLKEMIKYKGFQVPPAELEALLLTHPKVQDAGVVGVSLEEEATEVPRAFVVIVGGVDGLSLIQKTEMEIEIERWVSGQVSNHKRLRGGVKIIASIPKSSSGKILRKDLRLRASQKPISKPSLARAFSSCRRDRRAYCQQTVTARCDDSNEGEHMGLTPLPQGRWHYQPSSGNMTSDDCKPQYCYGSFVPRAWSQTLVASRQESSEPMRQDFQAAEPENHQSKTREQRTRAVRNQTTRLVDKEIENSNLVEQHSQNPTKSSQRLAVIENQTSKHAVTKAVSTSAKEYQLPESIAQLVRTQHYRLLTFHILSSPTLRRDEKLLHHVRRILFTTLPRGPTTKDAVVFSGSSKERLAPPRKASIPNLPGRKYAIRLGYTEKGRGPNHEALHRQTVWEGKLPPIKDVEEAVKLDKAVARLSAASKTPTAENESVRRTGVLTSPDQTMHLNNALSRLVEQPSHHYHLSGTTDRLSPKAVKELVKSSMGPPVLLHRPSHTRQMASLLHLIEIYQVRYSFNPDIVTLNILLKAQLRNLSGIDRDAASAIEKSTELHTLVTKLTQEIFSVTRIASMREVNYERHLEPMGKMLKKCLAKRGDWRRAREVIGWMKGSEEVLRQRDAATAIVDSGSGTTERGTQSLGRGRRSCEDDKMSGSPPKEELSGNDHG